MKRSSAHQKGTDDSRLQNRRGVTLVLVALMFTVLIGFVAMALDFGRMYSFKAELRRLSDAAAMSAAMDRDLGLAEGPAETNAFALIPVNTVENNATAVMNSSDIVAVHWNFGASNPDPLAAVTWGTATHNAVRVAAHYTANWTLARFFGSNTRVLNDTTVAAFGSLTTSNCIKPWAIPIAAILEKLGKPTPYNVNETLTDTDFENLDNSTTAIQFLDKDPPGGNLPGNFGWVDVNVSDIGNKNDQIAAAISGCVSKGLGVGSTLEGVPGARSANVVETALRTLCGGIAQGNGSNFLMDCTTTAPILVPIYDTGSGSGNNTTFHVRYIGAFRLTKLDAAGLWGYVTSVTVPASGTISNAPGPVSAVVIVR